MNILVVYDSIHGNTETIAKTIQKTLSTKFLTKLVKIDEFKLSDLDKIDVLVVGSPTHGGQATPKFQAFLKSLPTTSLKNLKFAAFDTGFLKKDHPFFLKVLISVIGYASPKISKFLIQNGAVQLVPPKTFYVKDKQGPLLKDQITFAKSWTSQILKNL